MFDLIYLTSPFHGTYDGNMNAGISSKTAHAHMRVRNLKSVLNAIMQSDGLSRDRIMDLTGLSHGTVSEIITALSEHGWIVETRQQNTGGARRRSRYVKINAAMGCVLALRVDSGSVQASFYDLAGTALTNGQVIFGPDSDKDRIISAVKTLVDRLIADAPQKLLGIGVALPGSVDRVAGVGRSASRITGWSNVDLSDELLRYFPVPAWVDNDLRLLSRGHLKARLFKPTDVAISVWLGDGIGAGIFIEGKTLIGHRGLSGELGHLHVQGDGGICTCGNRGCLETVASVKAVIRQIRHALASGVSSSMGHPDDISLNVIAHALQSGDKLAYTVCHQAAQSVAKALAQAVNLLSPNVILLAGPLLVLGDPLVELIKQHLKRYAHWEIMKGLAVYSTGPTVEHVLLGSALMALDHFWESALEKITESSR